MKKITLLLIVFLGINQLYSQSLYNRVWGRSFNNINSINSLHRIRLVEVKPSSEDLFVIYESNEANKLDASTHNVFGEIYIYNKSNSSTSLFYKFPHPIPVPLPPFHLPYVVRIENIKFDDNEDLIVYGRTHNADLATAGTYSQVPITTSFTGYSFIAKISRSGQLLWFTYFHDLAQNASTLTIDKNNNIYVVSKRDKNDVLAATSFQSVGDLSSNINYQEVISKLDSNGKHVWSTFYFKDDSKIRNVIAGNNGLYVYGDHFGGNGPNNYFGTAGSYQEYSAGLTSIGNSSTVFITKFNFNGSRAWSSYFGEQVSKCPLNLSGFPYGMTVIGDDAYILTDLKNVSTPGKNVATNGTYLTTPVSTTDNTTLTKFAGDGKRSFTTYLHGAEVIQKTKSDELLITTEIPSTYSNLSSLTTQNAYQKQHGGKSDVYNYILSNNGSTLKYGSFYGYDGNDSGITITTTNGYYVFGNSIANSAALTPFDSNGGLFTGSNIMGYSGGFIGYFTTKPLSNNEFNTFNVSIYPNPTTDVLNIQFKDIVPENTIFTIYDVAGKRVFNANAEPTDLNQINVSNLNSGVYILQINGSNLNQSVKFIKK